MLPAPMIVFPGARTKRDWLVTQITALVFLGNDEGDLDKAQVLADYCVYQLDGQDAYDLGGEG